jgi:predicted metal-dependent HD superfamily phosphohydrolase
MGDGTAHTDGLAWAREAVGGRAVARARTHYEDLPDHDFGHVAATLRAAAALHDRALAHDRPVDRRAVAAALLFHDADYRPAPGAHGYGSREARSAAVAGHELARLGVAAPVRRRAERAVLATRPGAATGEMDDAALLVRAADLRGLGADYERFERNTERLRREHELLTGETVSRTEWAVRTVRTLAGTYLADDVRLTPAHDEDGHSAFHARAGRNLGLLLGEYCDADRVAL